MILFKSLLNVFGARRSTVVFFINFQLLVVMCTVQISLSLPMESFVYETNPVQKLSFQYSQDGSRRPIRIKLQTISFKINEQLPTLDVYQDSMQESAENSFPIKNETKLNKKEELRELEKKFPLSRFTVFYNTPKRDIISKNIANNDIKQVNSTTENQNETEDSDKNTNTKDSKTDRDENKFNANSVTEINLENEDEATESKPELSMNVHEIQINITNKEKINSLLGTIKNEYEIFSERVSVQDDESKITTEIMLENDDTLTESYENVDKEANALKPKENNESEYESTYEISNDKNIDHHQTTETITIEDLQTDIYDITTEGYTWTDEYEESGNITESENRKTNSSKYSEINRDRSKELVDLF